MKKFNVNVTQVVKVERSIDVTVMARNEHDAERRALVKARKTPNKDWIIELENVDEELVNVEGF